MLQSPEAQPSSQSSASRPLPSPRPLRPVPRQPRSANASPPLSKNQRREAQDAYLAGARLLDRNDLTGAETQFAKALKLDPENHDYVMAAEITREHRVTELVQQSGKARLMGQTKKAEALLAQASLLDPENPIVTQHLPPGALPVAFHSAIEPPPSPGLKKAPPLPVRSCCCPTPAPRASISAPTFRLPFSQVLSSYGIRAVFDDSVGHQNLRFDLEDVQYGRAVSILLQMGGLFAVPLDSTSVIIASDTPENRLRLERQLQETISIPGMTTQEMNDLGNVVRNIFDIKQLAIEKGLGQSRSSRSRRYAESRQPHPGRPARRQ